MKDLLCVNLMFLQCITQCPYGKDKQGRGLNSADPTRIRKPAVQYFEEAFSQTASCGCPYPQKRADFIVNTGVSLHMDAHYGIACHGQYGTP